MDPFCNVSKHYHKTKVDKGNIGDFYKKVCGNDIGKENEKDTQAKAKDKKFLATDPSASEKKLPSNRSCVDVSNIGKNSGGGDKGDKKVF